MNFPSYKPLTESRSGPGVADGVWMKVCVEALTHLIHHGVVDAKRLAIEAVPKKASFPSARVQFPDVCFDVHKRCSADGPQMS